MQDTSPDVMVQLCFLESVKPIFDKFQESFQVEGALIHNLPMYGSPSEGNDVSLSEAKGNTEENVAELLKLDMNHSDSQLKDSELEIGLPTITFYIETLTYRQRSLALRNSLIEALTCLHPAEKAKITSAEKIRKVGDSLLVHQTRGTLSFY